MGWGSGHGHGYGHGHGHRYGQGHGKQEGNIDKPSPLHVVAVAIDADKSSQHALKWAADHLISRSQIFFLLHVRQKITAIPTPLGKQMSISEVEEEVASAFLQQIDLQTKELLLPFQCFCSKRGLQCKEVILEETDIPKAIVDFIMHQSVDKLVLGASSRNAFTRAFKHADVPTSVSKAAPEFCSIFIISKGKISSIRPATNPHRHFAKSTLNFETSGNRFQSVKSEPDARHQMEVAGSEKTGSGRDFRFSGESYDDGMSEINSRASQTGGHLDFSYQSTISCPSPSRTSIDHLANQFPRDYLDGRLRQSRSSNMQNEYTYHDDVRKSSELNGSGATSWSNGPSFTGYEYSPPLSQEHSRTSLPLQSMEDVEPEMRRLKLELMQTVDMYNNPCKEAFNAKQQADEDLRMEEARFAEQEKTERQRFKVLLEAAQGVPRQKMMEIEGSKKNDGERRLLQDMIQRKEVLDGVSTDARYRKYTIEDIQKATENFSDDLKIGEGGYGPVFKASLDNTVVAIKILQADAAQGAKQFLQEIEVLSYIRHPNMVLLMGACPEYGCLVYEYMSNGCLEDRLFCRSNTTPLSWQLRFKIAAEIATGLLFLHQTKPEPLVHRDLKPGNILLDHNFVSKIADVGLARLLPPSVADAVTQYRMTAAAGTFCYIDPEYQQTGLLGIKSDIYALGIILLQLLTAAPPIGLAHHVENAIVAGKFERMLDPNVLDWPVEAAIKLAKLSLKCAELRKKDRPDLASVVLPELNRLRELGEGAFSSRS